MRTSYIVEFQHLFTNNKTPRLPKLFFDSPYIARFHIEKPSDSITAEQLSTDYDRQCKIYSVMESARKALGPFHIATIESIINGDFENKKVIKYVVYENEWLLLYNKETELFYNILNLPIIDINTYKKYIDKIKPKEYEEFIFNL